jgi:iron complex outermembrane receptor protein
MFKKTRVSSALATAFGGALLAAGLPASAQQPQALERVEITGSSIKRIEAEKALPVETSVEEIAKSRRANTEQLVQQIRGVVAGRLQQRDGRRPVALR